MAENRIQKLLFNEYSDFEDIVLIESPFAQTTKDGVGVRQVQMGLTPTKLILAGDILEKGMHFDPTVPIDPHIGTLELLSLFPVECVNMSVYRRKNRNTLKAHFCNDQVIYFELAASLKRDMYWNLWCERIKFLNPEEQSLSTHSETSVGSTSVSTSTQYKSSRMENTKRVNKCAELMVVNNMQMLNQTMDTFYVANNIEVKHRRRYGIAPMGILFHALGSISVQKPQLFSLQLKRCCSEVYISYVESEIEEMLGFPKRLLTSSVSCENLIEEKRSDKQLDNTPVRGSSKYNFYHGDYFFWTSKFWFKPWNGRYGYKKLLQHMENVQMYLRIQEMEQRKTLILTMKASDGDVDYFRPPIGTTAPSLYNYLTTI
ncbi:hypothetical protein O3M35_006395 [Rhynocoris fuscipes]|uniref:Uncharacterized protein n=1 Tax=Rhynocoris fuscipes TaxID=488301 RepID=A0AAW1DIK8_9HEMI